MIEILLKQKIGDLTQRNKIGNLPLEQPHNNILFDPNIKEVFRVHLESFREDRVAYERM